MRTDIRDKMPPQVAVLPGGNQKSEHQPSNAKRLLKKTGTRGLNDRDQNHQQDDPVRDIHAGALGLRSEPALSLASRQTLPEAMTLHIELPFRQTLIRLDVLPAGAARHLRRQGRRRWLFVPVNLFQVIPHVLLIEGRLRLSWLVEVHRPEARRIRR